MSTNLDNIKQGFHTIDSAPSKNAASVFRLATEIKGVLRPLTPRSKDVAAGTRVRECCVWSRGQTALKICIVLSAAGIRMGGVTSVQKSPFGESVISLEDKSKSN